MPYGRYHHFILTKEEEEKSLRKPEFPLYTCLLDLVDIRNGSPVLLDLLSPWEFKKVLNYGDAGSLIGNVGGLVLSREHVQAHWQLDWDAINHGQQVPVVIRDVDTKTDYTLYLRKWNNDDNFIIQNNWTRDFVYRRKLKEGDTIAMCWNRQLSKIFFSVMKRAGGNSEKIKQSKVVELDCV